MRSTLTSHKMEVDGNTHRSQLPQPRKFTTSVNCLSEVSESQSNIRNKQSFTPLPTNSKHKIMLNQSEPEPKRRTLVERAGEITSNKAPAMSGTRQNIKSTSLTRSVRSPDDLCTGESLLKSLRQTDVNFYPKLDFYWHTFLLLWLSTNPSLN
ncbi:putative minus-end-directed microtubule motor [Golovinomyces cichoracearum]|uniref:Putative minus-end-directed microtubule motor n=1 Tax=Golovinomyces cichoracearum TaxID=62708 RepID=A0A420IQ30_9PEZI|nr:putative minus-end-directed microtubule motor [Golovinomyces cichoracearum]